MQTVFKRTAILKDCPTHYCPGCGHGIAHRLVAECIDELDIRQRTIGIAPVGCAVLLYDYIDVDCIEVAHGRAPAVATGMKRTNPDKIVFSYQGDGDLASIGAAEILHAGNRGERLTIIFINNAVYGMTGGQMAPTTMIDQVTATSPRGRQAADQGYPLQVSEMMALLPGVIYVERTAMDGSAGVRKTKKAIKHAFELQIEGAEGLALVEVLSPCPTYWRMPPAKAMEWIKTEMTRVFPVGVLKG
jgi:2-oxoglutarate ferredoxin oxidoreductase subunit beta